MAILLPPIPRRCNDIDWSTWEAVDRCTLTFVVRDERILLIRKRRGLGAGKINGPGGRLEPGETELACAVREVEEELRVTPTGLEHLGRLRFQFVDGYSTDVFVYRAADCEGEAQQTDEAIPLWTPVDAIPYDEMWEDDRLWLPDLLEGRCFDGGFVFEGDALLDHRLERSA
ncbi:MAG: 8-oxo-dGTP diphosphatase [Myxococcota bacterium]|nr:8-oxo-dGTP diphosphatase [Myxococcota bacterium]